MSDFLEVDSQSPWTQAELELVRAATGGLPGEPALELQFELAPSDTSADFVDQVCARVERELSLHATDGKLKLEPKPHPRRNVSRDPSRFRWPLAAAAAALLAAMGGLALMQLRAHGGASGSKGVVAGPPLGVDAVGRTRGPLPAALNKDLQAWVGRFGQRYGVAFQFSGVVLVARGESQVVQGFGRRGVFSEGLPGAETSFRVGALTQPMVALAAERMAKREEIDFDHKVSRYVSGLPAAWGQVRVEDLITHRSGIPNFTDTLAWDWARDEVHEARQLWGYVQSAQLKFQPGTDFEASNTNYLLLGEVLAAASKSSLDEVLRKEVFEPAGMVDSRLGMPPQPTGAQGMSFDEDELLVPARRVAPSAYGGAGGLTTSARDLVAFHRALESGVLLDARRQREMYKSTGSYGRGWASRYVDGDFEVSHPGGLDGFNAEIVRRLDDGTLVVVLANTDAVRARDVAQGVMAMVQGEQPEPPIERVERPIPQARIDDYVGDFVITAATRARLEGAQGPRGKLRFERVSIRRRGATLWMDVPDHARKWMHGLSDDRFFFKDRSGTLATFVRGDADVGSARGTPGPVIALVLQVGETRLQLEPVAAP